MREPSRQPRRARVGVGVDRPSVSADNRGVASRLAPVILAVLLAACGGAGAPSEGTPTPPSPPGPPITLDQWQALKLGTPKAQVFAAVGVGKLDEGQRQNDACYIYAFVGGQPDSLGSVPVTELCFDNAKLVDKSRGRI